MLNYRIFLFICLSFLICETSFAQIYTTTWDPTKITPEQKEFIDSCDKYDYDTLGNRISGLASRYIWVDGNYFEYIEIDSANKIVSRKFRKTTDLEKENRKKKTLDDTSIKELIGKPFPNLEMIDLNGNTYVTSDFENKTVHLNFWFVGCQACELERYKLNQLYERYKDNEDVIFISFSNSNEGKTRRYLEKKDFLWPVVLFNKKLKKDFQFIQGYPTNIIINKLEYNTALQGIMEGTFLIIEEQFKLLTTNGS